jgi:uncharacterized protein DUF642
MRQSGTILRKEPVVAGPERRRRRRTASIAALGMIPALGIVWALATMPAPIAPRGAPGSGNLLVNGSFEQPVGGLLTLGRSISWWQRFQMWYRFNSEINRLSISRRQRPVYFPFPPPPPELTGWRLLKGTVDLVGRGYWQQAPGQGNQSLDLIGSPGAATIEQAFPTEPGREYLFSGWLSHNPVIDPALVRRANVYLNDRLFVQLVHGDPKTTRRNMRWKHFSYRFRATSSRTTLKLQDVTMASGTPASYLAVQLCGTVLDGLSVTPVAASRAGG